MALPSTYIENQGTKNSRRSLIGTSILALIVSWTKFAPSGIETFGIEFNVDNTAQFLLFLTLVNISLIITFAVYGWTDYCKARLDALESLSLPNPAKWTQNKNNMEIGEEKEFTDPNSAIVSTDEIEAVVNERFENEFAEQKKNQAAILRKEKTNIRRLLQIRWFFEYTLPIILGIVGSLSLVYRSIAPS